MLSKIIDACQFLFQQFPDAQDCRDYLDSRLNKNTQELFQFGYFPTISNLSALSSIVGEDILIDSKLLFKKDIEDSCCARTINISFLDNYPLIMPYKDTYGNIIAIVGRTLLSENERKDLGIAKYKNTVFSKGKYLFGLDNNKQSILQQDCVYVVEGQFDVIKSVESGFTNIVALGNSNMTYEQLSLICRYTNNIFLLLDNDEAGEKGRKRAVDLFSKYANIRNFYLPDHYKDIDEFLSENSYEDISFIVRED